MIKSISELEDQHLIESNYILVRSTSSSCIAYMGPVVNGPRGDRDIVYAKVLQVTSPKWDIDALREVKERVEAIKGSADADITRLIYMLEFHPSHALFGN